MQASGVHQVDERLRSLGGLIDQECLLTLEDMEGVEFEPEYIQDGEEALERLVKWPALGTIAMSSI